MSGGGATSNPQPFAGYGQGGDLIHRLLAQVQQHQSFQPHQPFQQPGAFAQQMQPAQQPGGGIFGQSPISPQAPEQSVAGWGEMKAAPPGSGGIFANTPAGHTPIGVSSTTTQGGGGK